MTGHEDRVRALLAESGITGPDGDELATRLSALEQYVDDTPPEPSPQLAAVMAGKATAAVVLPFTRRRGRLLVASLVAVGAVGAGGIAAAANELPSPAQDLVAELSERYLPFSLPRPPAPTADEASPAESGPDPVPPPSPAWGSDDESPRRERLAGPWTTPPADPMPTPSRSKAAKPTSSPTPGEDTTPAPEESVVPTEPDEDPSVPDAGEVTGDGTTSEEGTSGTGSTTGTGSADGTGTTDATGSAGTGSTDATSGSQTSGGDTTAGGEPVTSPKPSSGASPSAGSRRTDPPSRAERHSRGKAKGRGTAVWSDL